MMNFKTPIETQSIYANDIFSKGLNEETEYKNYSK